MRIEIIQLVRFNRKEKKNRRMSIAVTRFSIFFGTRSKSFVAIKKEKKIGMRIDKNENYQNV